MMMKYLFKIVLSFILVFSFITMTACQNEEGSGSVETTSKNELLLSSYQVPENFFMTLQLSDTSIFNKGNPWYYKTAKIGNDWQLIEYDRDLEDLSKQTTHFFLYESDNLYTHYIYQYETTSWEEVGEVTFEGMVFTSPNNFKFLYEKPTGPQYNITETNISYDCDPTSVERRRDAYLYENSDGLDIDIIVDRTYPNVMLSETDRDGSRIVISWRAYEYKLTISNWDDTHLANNNFKPF